MTTVTVYHNISRDASFGLNATFSAASGKGYQARSHELVKVFEFDAAALPGAENPDAVYRAFNVGDDPGYASSAAEFDLAVAYRARDLRSLSVGDVVA